MSSYEHHADLLQNVAGNHDLICTAAVVLNYHLHLVLCLIFKCICGSFHPRCHVTHSFTATVCVSACVCSWVCVSQCVVSISLLYLFWHSVLLWGRALHSSDKRAVMSTLGAVKEPPGRVDILQHSLFTLTTEFSHQLAFNALMTRGFLEWSPLLALPGTGSLLVR